VNFIAAAGSKAIDPANERRIQRLDQAVQTRARLFVNLSAAAGAPIRITQGLRTFEEQDALYAQGRTASGDVVTNARGGQSYHNYGLAVDVAPVENGRVNPNHYPQNQAVTVGKSLGWEWGGDWKTFKDRPHFQITGGKSIRQLQQERQ
jgi:peptidoglycan LD-endopeptidase CwlK